MPYEDLHKLLYGINVDLPEGGSSAPAQETNKPQVFSAEAPEAKVFVQKLVTEVWVYTDIDKKNYGTSSIQDIIILGEMTKDAALKMIGERKERKRKKSE